MLNQYPYQIWGWRQFSPAKSWCCFQSSWCFHCSTFWNRFYTIHSAGLWNDSWGLHCSQAGRNSWGLHCLHLPSSSWGLHCHLWSGFRSLKMINNKIIKCEWNKERSHDGCHLKSSHLKFWLHSTPSPTVGHDPDKGMKIQIDTFYILYLWEHTQKVCKNNPLKLTL